MCITWPHICFTIHLLWCIIYTTIGTIQIICGVFFFVSLPILKLGSNIWVGAWNVLFGIGGGVTAMIGKWTMRKQKGFLYLAISILIANVINLVLLEVGEWHMLLPERTKKLIQEGNVKTLLLYARTLTSLSTIVAAVVAFFDSQLTFCSMQYHEKYHNKKVPPKQDMLSDTEYVLPRVKSDSDENGRGAAFYDKQYAQSWVYETQTAETSTVNSAPNRYSGSSNENVLDSKHTSSEIEFKDISTQNLHMEQPIVVVEKTADYTDRQLHYMTSFSRTPSPVPGSDSSSIDSQSNDPPTKSKRSSETVDVPSAYRGRLHSVLSASGIPQERISASTSPRPPSISGMDELQQELLRASLQESISQKSFKISADQIFIPLKDETVIRVKDEVFILPSPKATSKVEESIHQMTAESVSPPPPPHPSQPSPPLSMSSFKNEEVLVAAPAHIIKTDYVSEPHIELQPAPRRPTLPEIVDAVRKESFLTTSTVARTPTPEKEKSFSVPISEQTPPDEDGDDDDSTDLQNSAASSQDTDFPTSEEGKMMASSPPGTYVLPSPVLGKQSKFGRQDTVIERGCQLPSPMLERQPKFDRQETVMEKKPVTPTPGSDRQSQIERQDAVFSPREDQSFIPPLLEPSLVDEGRADDAELIHSNHASTDKESVTEFKGNDENLNGWQRPPTPPELFNRFDLIEDISCSQGNVVVTNNIMCGNEIDNIFKIAEDPRLGTEDRADAELFHLQRGSQELPPPDIDPSMFANIPPPEVDETNTVDTDEWEESEDDSIDSSTCVRQVPPTSTSNDRN